MLPEGSQLVASSLGDPRFANWRTDTFLLAAIANEVKANTIATGQWKRGHTPKFEPILGPQPDKKRAPVSGAKQSKLARLAAQFAPKQ